MDTSAHKPDEHLRLEIEPGYQSGFANEFATEALPVQNWRKVGSQSPRNIARYWFSTFACLFSVTITRTSSQSAFTCFLDGLAMYLPLYLRTLCPRESERLRTDLHQVLRLG